MAHQVNAVVESTKATRGTEILSLTFSIPGMKVLSAVLSDGKVQLTCVRTGEQPHKVQITCVEPEKQHGGKKSLSHRVHTTWVDNDCPGC